MNNSKKETILLTGANGFLGSYILRSIVAHYNVIILIRSFSNTSRITDLMPQCTVYNLHQITIDDVFHTQHIDYVLHCATHYGRRDKDPMEIIEANLIYPLKLLHLAVRHNVAHFINTDTILDKRISQYSLSKKQFLDWLLRYKEQINVVNILLEHFFGPGDDDSKFVTRFILDCLQNVPVIPLTKGEQRRDLIYISDVVRAFILILEHIAPLKDGYVEYEVGSGHSISIYDLCNLIKSLSGNDTTKLNFGAIDYRPNEMMDSRVDIGKLATLGWAPSIGLELGLMSTIEDEKRRLS